MSFLMFLILLTGPDKALEPALLEEVRPAGIVAATTAGDVTFFQTISYISGLVETFYFFQHADQQLFKLKDGRLPKLCHIVAAVGGKYLILSSEKERMAIIGPDYHLIETTQPAQFFKFPPDLHGRISYISPYRDGQLLLTLRQENGFALALFSEGKPLQIVSQQVPEYGAGSVYWVYGDQTLYFIQGEIAKIHVVQPDFSLGTLVDSGEKPHPNPFAKLEGQSKFETLVYTVIPHQDHVRFSYKHFSDNQDTATIEAWVLDGLKTYLSDDDRVMVGQGDSLQLMYDVKERVLMFEPRPTPSP